MKLVFISNYFNHHQKPLSDAFYQKLGDDYVFVQTIEMEKERINMGWSMSTLPPYVKSLYIDSEHDECIRYINEADAVIYGSTPSYLLNKRKRANKLIFGYSERPLKRSESFVQVFLRSIKWHIVYSKRKSTYMLCASAYTAHDYALMGLFKGKTYKWGYFPETKTYDNVERLLNKKKKGTILWVARFLDWKHPELPIKLAKKLSEKSYDFSLDMIGVGEEFEKIKALIEEYNLAEKVHLLGSMSPEMVREHMEQSEIFVFTSDRNEGWGAVLNESMNSGCAVVANEAIGSVPFLIKDGYNGCIYADGNFEDLYKKVTSLLENSEKRLLLGKNAYATIVKQWNADVASKNFIELYNHIKNGEFTNEINDAPCAPDYQ